MALPEFVVPVLSTAGSFGLLCVIVRNFPQILQELMVALATVVVIFTRDEQRHQRGLEVLGKLTGQDGPDKPPRRRPLSRGDSGRQARRSR